MSMSAQETSANQKNVLKRWKPAWIGALLVLFVLGVVLAGAPLLISQQFQKWVLANGGEKVTLENVDFNPFTAELGFYNVVIERSGYRPFQLPELTLKARWKDLFARRFVIERVSLNGAQLTLDQSQPGQEHVGGILLKNLVVQQAPEPETEEEPWSFQLVDLRLRDFKLAYKHPALQSVIDVETLSIERLDTDPLAEPADISLKGVIDAAPFALDGRLDLFSAEPGFDGRVVLEGLPLGRYLKRLAEEMQQNTAIVSVDSKLDIVRSADGGFTLEQAGEWALQEVRWQDGALALNAQRLGWGGDISAQVSARNALRLNTNGRLRGNDLGFEDRDSGLSIQDQQLVWEGRSETALTPGRDLELTLNGQLRNRQLAVGMPAQPMQLQNGELDWQGSVNVDLAAAGGMTVVTQGRLHNTGFALQRPAQQLDLVNRQLHWQGELSLQTVNDRLALESSSNLDLSGLRMQTLDTKEPMVLADKVEAKNLLIKALDEASLEQLAISGLSLGQEQKLDEFDQALPGFSNHEALLLEQVDYSAETGVHIGKIVMSGARHALIKTETGTWGFDSFLQAMDKLAAKTDDRQAVGSAQEANGDAPVEEKLAVRIDAVLVEQGGSLYIVDRSFAEPFAQRIDIDAFQLTDIDSSKPRAGSDLELVAKLETGSVDIQGQVALFAPEPTFELKGDIQALSLLPYGLFLKKYLGYEVESGSLNAEASLSAKEGQLDSTTELALHQLDIRALTEEELKALDATLNPGLETGLSMLKDKHNTIALSVPVKGSFDNLQVDPSDIINQALGSALQRGAKTYLAAALFPFGTLLVVADVAAGQAMQVKLDPVIFEPGSSDLMDDYPAYLEKVAGVLEEKPEIHVKVCGVATTSDESHLIDQMKQAFLKQQQDSQAAAARQKAQETTAKQEESEALPAFEPDTALLAKQLKALAIQRADTVSRFLIDKQNAQPKRLISCQPKFDLSSPRAKPRADLLL